MLHKPASPIEKDHAGPYKMRLGIWMFLIYLLIYAGFVAINLIKPPIMGMTILWGMNLATVYGFSLIIFALIEALIYDVLCRRREALLDTPDKVDGDGSSV